MAKRKNSTASRKCIFVFGMHRSGTSALNGAMELIGFKVGDNPMPANEHNQKGYFEDLDVCELNDRILSHFGRAWDSLSPVVIGKTSLFTKEIIALYTKKFAASPVASLKDPRFSITFPIWQAALKKMGVKTYAVVCVRDPIEVCSSLKARNKFSFAKSQILWSYYCLHAEKSSRLAANRLLVRYSEFLSNPESALRDALKMIGVIKPLKRDAISKVKNFLDPSLRHHKQSNSRNEPLFPWVTAIYNAFMEEPVTKDRFDNIFSEFAAIQQTCYPEDVALTLSADATKSTSALYLNTGNRFSENEKIEVLFGYSKGTYVVEFEGLEKFEGLQSVRWDPIENSLIKLAVASLTITDLKGRVHDVAPDQQKINGVQTADGSFEFQTLDPWIEIALKFPIKKLTATGRIWILNQRTAFEKLHWQLKQIKADIHSAEELKDKLQQEKAERLSEAKAQISAMNNMLAEKSSLLNQVHEVRTQLEKERLKIVDFFAEKATLISRLNEKENNVSRLVNEKNALLKQVDDSTVRVEQIQQQKSDLQRQMEELKGVMDSAVREKERLETELKEFTTAREYEVRKQKLQITELVEERKILMEEIEELRTHTGSFREKYQEIARKAHDEKCALVQQIDQLKAEFNDVAEKHEALAREAVEEKQSLVNQAEAQREEIRHLMAGFEDASRTAANQINDLTLELIRQKSEAEQLAIRISNLIRDRDEEMSRLHQKIERQNSENASLKERLEALTSSASEEKANLTRQVAQEKVQVANLKNQLQDVSSQIHNFKEELFSNKQELAFYKQLFDETPFTARKRWAKRILYRLDRFFTHEAYVPDAILLHKSVFDPAYYLRANPVVASSLNWNADEAARHWLEKGIGEGLTASRYFDVKYYLSVHKDLKKYFKRNYKGAIKHWVEFGISEGRRASPTKERFVEVPNETPQVVSVHSGKNGFSTAETTGLPVKTTAATTAPKVIARKLTFWDQQTERIFCDRLSQIERENSGYFGRIPVSIIMPTYNRATRIGKAIDSVLAQTFRNWELLIVDDGSTDNTAEAIAAYTADARVKFIETAHCGVASARNAGLEAASGDFVFYLDSDNVWEKDFLKSMVIFMTVGELGAAYCGLRIVDGQDNTKAYRGVKFSWLHCYNQNYVDMNCFGHRRVEKFQYRFDQSLKRLVDWDFILRVTLNEKTSFAPICGVTYYDGEEGRRITLTEYQSGELKAVEDRIRKKHNIEQIGKIDEVTMYPEWNTFINEPARVVINDSYSAHFVELGEKVVDWEAVRTTELSPQLVSLVVLCFNNSAFSSNCIHSILSNSQSEKYTFEVVAVDNGSQDDTPNMLESLSRTDSRVRFVRSDENVMFSLGNNIGIAAARGEYTILLNNDTLVTPGWLDPLIDSLRLDPTIGAVGPKLLYEDGTLQCGGLVFSDKSKIPYHIYRGFERNHPAVNKPRIFQALTGACLAFRTADLHLLHGLDPSFINGCEDLDICFRLRAMLKKRSLYNPKSEIVHLESKSEGRGRFIARNREKFVARWSESVRADDAGFYIEDGFSIQEYSKPGKEADGNTASYVPTIKAVEPVGLSNYDGNGRPKKVRNIGFSSIWHARGISFHTKQLSDSLEGPELQTHIFARWEADKFWNEGPIHHARVTNAGDDPSAEEIVRWIKDNQIDLMIFMEVHPKDWKRVKAVKELGIPVGCYENLDTLRKDLIRSYDIFDFYLFNCFHTRQYFLAHFPDKRSLMVPWGALRSDVTARSATLPLRFVHVAGWGGFRTKTA